VTVFAAGCFNRVHPAHLRLLRRARTLGEKLVVVLSNDAHNKKSNAVPAVLRKRALEAFGVADEVVVGDPHGFAATLRRVRPDILVLGYDQRLPDEETEREVEKLGVEVVVMPWFPGKENSAASHCR
jgi:FAD synthetase